MVAASWSNAGDRKERLLTGPVVSLWVVDHGGVNPRPAQLAPYRQAFRRVLAGCWVSPAGLASAVFLLSDQASLDSGTNIDNLAVLQALARHVGVTRDRCDDDFAVVESRLEGAARF
jgi:hypothetical protein